MWLHSWGLGEAGGGGSVSKPLLKILGGCCSLPENVSAESALQFKAGSAVVFSLKMT